jgi:hypothetical protein
LIIIKSVAVAVAVDFVVAVVDFVVADVIVVDLAIVAVVADNSFAFSISISLY